MGSTNPDVWRLDETEYYALMELLTRCLSPPYRKWFRKLALAPGPGGGGRAGARIWRTLPPEELDRLELILGRLVTVREVGRL
jgi:hypothetical protein